MNSPKNFEGILKLEKASSGDEIDKSILALLSVSLDDIRREGIFIFGVGKLGNRICEFLKKNNIPVRGFVDNGTRHHGQKIQNILISSPSILKNNDIVYIASETYLTPIRSQLFEMGLRNLVSHFQGTILFRDAADFPSDIFHKGITSDLYENRGEYLKVFSRLEDEHSKKVMDGLIHYRLTADIARINDIASDGKLEYFDPSVFGIGSDEVFFDCGAFDGDSAENFLNYCGAKYKSVHLFEPDPGLLKKAMNRLTNFRNIEYNPLGIFDKTTTLHFDSTGGLDGAITVSGGIEIRTTSLDDYSKDPTYVKLDIEGVEIEALNGGIKTIERLTPKMAIASYHYPWHLWQIPSRVFEINQHYRVRLRHYSNCIFGSTFYFLPE